MQGSGPWPGTATQNLHLNPQTPRRTQGAHSASFGVLRAFEEKEQVSALKAEACPALDKAAVPMREARPQGAPRSSRIALAQPGPSPVKPLAWPGPTARSRASRASPRVLSMAGSVALRLPEREKGPFCLSPVLPTVAMASEAVSQGVVPYVCSLTPAAALRVPRGACASRPFLAPGRWHL